MMLGVRSVSGNLKKWSCASLVITYEGGKMVLKTLQLLKMPGTDNIYPVFFQEAINPL